MDANLQLVAKGGPEDLIATAWFGLGFKPTESLVLAGLQGPNHRVGVILRTDLPGRHPHAGRVRAMVWSSLQTIAASPAHSVMALIASEQALDQPVPPIVDVVRRAIRARGLTTFDIVGVTSTAYHSLLCDGSCGCPPEHLPIERVMSSQAAACHVLHGDRLADSEADLIADVLPCGPDQPGPADWDGFAGWPRLTVAERLGWWRRWRAALDAAPGGPFDGDLALDGFSAALYDPYLRDAVLMHLLGSPVWQLSAMLHEQHDLHEEADPAKPEDDADADLPDLGLLLTQFPDERGLSAGLSVLAGAARVAVPGARSPALALLALLAWYQSQGGRSRLLVQSARADDPDFSLAVLVDDLLLSRTPPPWVPFGPAGPADGESSE